MWEILTTKLKQILEANTLISNTYSYEASDISGTPVATLTPSANESDYTTTTENTRVYAFMLRLYVDRPSGENNEQVSEEAMRQLVDDVLDNFDKDPQLSGISLPTGYTMVTVRPAKVVWGQVPETHLITAVIDLEVKVEFNINS